MSMYPSVSTMSNLDGGTFFIKSLLAPNLFLDLNHKNKVVVDVFNNKESQKWILKGSPVSAGNYAIINAEKNLPITIHSDFWGVRYAVVKPSNNNAELDLECYCWRHDSVKQMIEISPAPFKTKKRVVLDVKGASAKPLTELIVYEENEGPNQQFQFVTVVTPASPPQQPTVQTQTQHTRSPSVPVEEVKQLPVEQTRTLQHVESASSMHNHQQQQQQQYVNHQVAPSSHKSKLHFHVSLKPEILQALEASSKVQQLSHTFSKQPSNAQPSHFYSFDAGLERGEIERIQDEMNKENLRAEEIQKRTAARSRVGKQLPPPPRISTEQQQQQPAPSSTSSSFTQQQQQSQSFDPFSGIPVYNPSSFYGGNPNVLIPPTSYPQYQSPYGQAPDPNRHA